MGAGAGAKAPKEPVEPTAPKTMLPTQSLQLPGKLERLYLGIGWGNKGRSIDLDASAASFAGTELRSLVYFSTLKDRPPPSSSIVHTGDVLTGGDGKDDLERIYFKTEDFAADVTSVFLIINVFTSSATFADVDSAYCRLANADSNQELASFRLTDLKDDVAIVSDVRLTFSITNDANASFGMAMNAHRRNNCLRRREKGKRRSRTDAQ